MGEPRSNVCEPWATVDDLCSPCDDYSLPAGLAAQMLDFASNHLFKVTGRQYPGICDDVLRPCRSNGHHDRGYRHWRNGQTHRWGSCNACGCGGLEAIELGRFPLVDVTSVKVDGATLAASAYRIDNYRSLVRLDGDTWPCCQDLSLASTEADTFEVTVTFGRTPPDDGILAAAALACELMKACSPETFGECRLPQRVRTVVRQNVSADFAAVLDPMDIFERGMTGLPEVDLFITSENPNRLQRPPVVWSPDVRRRSSVIDT